MTAGIDPSTSTDDLYDGAAVRRLFDRMSRSYERMNIVMSFGFSVRWRRQVIALVPPQATGARVLDAMCGMGETWSELLRRFPDAHLEALDFSPVMVQHALERNAERFGSRFTVHTEDMLASSLDDGTLDVVVSAYGLKTFSEEQSVVFADELARILKPGGRFAFIEVTEPPNPVLRSLYRFYLGIVVPVIGTLLVSDPTEYRMLHRYLARYGNGDRSARALAAHPELVVERRSHFFGGATSFAGHRIDTA